jgi:hypothetical protein
MARYVPTALFEEFSGKIGNAVFARNKGGRYLRGYVVPYNPETTQQVVAREIFTTVAPLWGTLGTSDREAWDIWANAGYTPLQRPTAETTYTGRQAFSALQIATRWAEWYVAEYGVTAQLVTVGGNGATSVVTSPFAPVTVVPATFVGSNVLSYGTFHTSITDFDATYTGSDDWAIKIYVDDLLPAATYTAQPFAIGNRACGLAVYLSNEVAEDGFSTESDFVSKLMTELPIESFTVTIGTPSLEWNFRATGTEVQPTRLGWYKATLVAITAEGQQHVIMSKYVEFT